MTNRAGIVALTQESNVFVVDQATYMVRRGISLALRAFIITVNAPITLGA